MPPEWPPEHVQPYRAVRLGGHPFYLSCEATALNSPSNTRWSPGASTSNQMTSIPDRLPPSTTSYVVATAILAVSIGYFIGQASSLGLFSSPKSKSSGKKSWPNNYDVTIHPDSSDEELMTHLRGNGGKEVKDTEDEGSEDEELGQEQERELKAFEGNREECKLVLVVRTDLGMGKGTNASPKPIDCFNYLNNELIISLQAR